MSASATSVTTTSPAFMTHLTADPANFRQLFLNDIPFLDVRAEVEFEKGAFPSSFNEPILRNDERHQVGSCYKQQGQDEAIALGHRFVSGDTKQQRIDNWCQFARQQSQAHLYCWRGGMRSNLTQQWMREAGVDIPLIPGGYKALRNVLLDELEAASRSSMVIIGGKTGAAKTPFVNEVATGIDLEGFAHHRGSSFGRRVEEPPCQVNFENALAIDLMKKREAYPDATLFIEDESRMVGPLSIPLNFWEGMIEAPVAVIDMPLDFRVQRILQEYVVDMAAEHLAVDATNGFDSYRQSLLASLGRIRKRLGLERYASLDTVMSDAIDRQQASGDVADHRGWIAPLLEEYYDPMYDYQLEQKRQRVVFSGSYAEVLEWAAQA